MSFILLNRLSMLLTVFTMAFSIVTIPPFDTITNWPKALFCEATIPDTFFISILLLLTVPFSGVVVTKRSLISVRATSQESFPNKVVFPDTVTRTIPAVKPRTDSPGFNNLANEVNSCLVQKESKSIPFKEQIPRQSAFSVLTLYTSN